MQLRLNQFENNSMKFYDFFSIKNNLNHRVIMFFKLEKYVYST